MFFEKKQISCVLHCLKLSQPSKREFLKEKHKNIPSKLFKQSYMLKSCIVLRKLQIFFFFTLLVYSDHAAPYAEPQCHQHPAIGQTFRGLYFPDVVLRIAMQLSFFCIVLRCPSCHHRQCSPLPTVGRMDCVFGEQGPSSKLHRLKRREGVRCRRE